MPGRKYQAPKVDASKTVPKPSRTTQLSERDFQLQQLRRRYSPVETSTVESALLAFKLRPTDPDFPYELEALDCILQVPKTYPENVPTLNIQNSEMERGFQINIERGFDAIVAASPKGNLLAHLNNLDRQLEAILSGRKAGTIKFVANNYKATENSAIPSHPEKAKIVIPEPPQYLEPAYSAEQLAAASAKRDMDTRQLEARLGRQALFAKSSDGIAYILPIEPRRKLDLPTALQSVNSVRLFVPMLYPLLPCRVALQQVAREAARPVEVAFEQRAKENPETTLIGHINYLVTQMHVLAAESIHAEKDWVDEVGIENIDITDNEDELQDQPRGAVESPEHDRNHLHVVPRPPEWNVSVHGGNSELDSEVSDASEDSASDVDAQTSVSGPERGVSIDLPSIELNGIELLELKSLSVTVKCTRCKSNIDVENLHHTDANVGGLSRSTSCHKCSSVLHIGINLPSLVF
jgi:hypothetical protein